MVFLRRPMDGSDSDGQDPAVRYRTNRRIASLNIVSGRVRVLEKRRRSRWLEGQEEGGKEKMGLASLMIFQSQGHETAWM